MQSWQSAAILATSKLLFLQTHSFSGSVWGTAVSVCILAPQLVPLIVEDSSVDLDFVGWIIVVDLISEDVVASSSDVTWCSTTVVFSAIVVVGIVVDSEVGSDVLSSSGPYGGGKDVGAALMIEKLLLCRSSASGGSTASFGTHSDSAYRFASRCW